ncbi:hypothetical protein P3393_23955, partial [Vibrio parahaemolyticus]|nr:hypothetical protein [Vibrio parahaemolyticus]
NSFKKHKIFKNQCDRCWFVFCSLVGTDKRSTIQVSEHTLCGAIVMGQGAQQFVCSMMPAPSVGIIGYLHRPFINFQ